MKNHLEEYLEWRGDLSFLADPFNEVDNVLLSVLAYTDLEGISFEGGLTIREVRDAYFSLHTREEVLARKEFTRFAPLLLDPMAESTRFGSCRILEYCCLFDVEKTIQFSAVIFELAENTRYIAFRGTDSSIVGWKEDFSMSWSAETEGQRLAAEYLNTHYKDTDLRLMTGGHSKGGNYAVYAAAFSLPEVRRQIVRAYSNDGPGFRSEVLEKEGYREILPRIISIVPDGSIIGMLLENDLTDRVVKSSNSGIMQHDAFSWEIRGNSFVRAEKSKRSSVFINKTIRQWLENIDTDSRKKFVDTLFNLLEASGDLTFPEMMNHKLHTLQELKKYLSSLSREEQQEFFGIFTSLFAEGGKVLTESLPGPGDLFNQEPKKES